jgi:hypothetical protein
MIIRNLENTTGTKRARISATVEWEDCHYPDRDVFFETDVCFAGSLSPDPNAFLLAAIIPATHFGERRIMVEGQLCPQLRDGLDIVVRQLRKWYGGEGDYIRIEASEGFNPPPVPSERRVACCMSGGVDTLITFKRNRISIPLDHPSALKGLPVIATSRCRTDRGHRSTDQDRSKRRDLGNCAAHRAWLSDIFRDGVRLHGECNWKECLDRELYDISPVFENAGILARQWTYPHAVASQAK